MATSPAPDVTELLLAWRQDDADALGRLLPRVYAALRRLAHARMRAESPGCRMVSSGPGLHSFPVWSPDGRFLAYVGEEERKEGEVLRLSGWARNSGCHSWPPGVE